MRKSFAALVVGCSMAPCLLAQDPSPSPEVFEAPPTLSAAAILQPAFFQGPHFQVEDAVPTAKGVNEYTINSDFGVFHAAGNDMLMRRVGEIRAIAELKRISRTDQFEKAAAKAAKSPLIAAKNLVAHPVDTLSGVQKGVWKFLNQAGQSVKEIGEGQRPDAADGGIVANISGYSKVKRDIALRLGVDPYSTNTVFQQALDNVAWPTFAGGLTVKIGLAGVTYGLGTAGTAIAATDMTGNLNNLLRDNSPTDLRLKNLGILLKMGMSRADADAFLNNSAFSPSTQTMLVVALQQLSQATGRDQFVRLASTGINVQEALFFQQSAQLMAKLNAESPVMAISDLNGLPVCQVEGGTVVVPLPWDYVVWTPMTERFVRALKATTFATPASGLAIAVTGVLSQMSAQALTAREVRFSEKELPNPLK